MQSKTSLKCLFQGKKMLKNHYKPTICYSEELSYKYKFKKKN